MITKSFFKTVGTGLGTAINAVAEAAVVAQDRRAAEARSNLHRKLNSYDYAACANLTDEALDAILHVMAEQPSQPSWMMINGHLPNCRQHCTYRHCLDCGEVVYGVSVRCSNCR